MSAPRVKISKVAPRIWTVMHGHPTLTSSLMFVSVIKLTFTSLGYWHFFLFRTILFLLHYTWVARAYYNLDRWSVVDIGTSQGWSHKQPFLDQTDKGNIRRHLIPVRVSATRSSDIQSSPRRLDWDSKTTLIRHDCPLITDWPGPVTSQLLFRHYLIADR